MRRVYRPQVIVNPYSPRKPGEAGFDRPKRKPITLDYTAFLFAPGQGYEAFIAGGTTTVLTSPVQAASINRLVLVSQTLSSPLQTNSRDGGKIGVLGSPAQTGALAFVLELEKTLAPVIQTGALNRLHERDVPLTAPTAVAGMNRVYNPAATLSAPAQTASVV